MLERLAPYILGTGGAREGGIAMILVSMLSGREVVSICAGELVDVRERMLHLHRTHELPTRFSQRLCSFDREISFEERLF